MNLSDQETPETEEKTYQGEEDEQQHGEAETAVEDELELTDESGDTPREQAGDAAVTPVAAETVTKAVATTAKAVTWKEDPLDFDESTVEIAITLHPLRGGRAEERLLTLCIHNHSGNPLYDSARQSELTAQSALDRLQGWIAKNVKKFRAELSTRKQQQWEQNQKLKQGKREQKGRTTSASTGAVTPSSGTPTAKETAAVVQEGETPAHTLPGASSPPSVASSPTTAITTTSTRSAAKQAEDGLVQQSLF